MITALALDPGKFKAGYATVRAVRERERLVLLWIVGGHAEPTAALLDAQIAMVRSTRDTTKLFAVEEVRQAFRGKFAGDLIATAKQEERIVQHLRGRDFEVRRAPAAEWRRALTGVDGPSDEAIAIVVCGLVMGARGAPITASEREHAYDAAGLAVYAIARALDLLTELGRVVLPQHVEAALAEQLLRDKTTQRAKREAKKAGPIAAAIRKARSGRGRAGRRAA